MASYCDGKAKYILEVVCSHQQRFGENVNVGVDSNPTKEKKEDQEELESGNKGYLARDKDEEQESRDGQLGRGQCQCLILKRRRDKKAKMIKQ